MASTDQASVKNKSRPAKAVLTDTVRRDLRTKITNLINSHFSNTLGKLSPRGLPHVVDLVMALIYKESTFNPNRPGVQYDIRRKGTEAFKYANCSVIKPFLQTTGQERFNVEDAARAFGLMQVNGYYAVKGTFEGKGELLRMRPDIAGPLMVNPGESIRSKLLGENNIDNQLLAGLIVLEEKHRVAKVLAKGSPNSSLLALTFAGYLGFGKKDQLGTTPESYAKDIISGNAFAKANGTDPIYVASNATVESSSKGPTQTVSSGISLSVAGC